MERETILQIIPAPTGMFAQYNDGSHFVYDRVACLALVQVHDTVCGTLWREIWPMVLDAGGRFICAHDTEDYDSTVFKKE